MRASVRAKVAARDRSEGDDDKEDEEEAILIVVVDAD